MNYRIFILLITLCLPFTLLAQKTDTIAIIIFSENYSGKLFPKQYKTTYGQLPALNTKIINTLHNNGYYSACTDSVISKNNFYLIYISTGNQYVIKSFYINNNLVSEKITAKKYYNKPFTTLSLNEFLNQQITIFNNTGYPFASMSIDSVYLENKYINVYFKANKNNRVYFNKTYLIIDTVLTSKSRHIVNLCGINKNKTFNMHNINNIQPTINSTEYLKITQKPEIVFYSDSADIYLHITKLKSGSFDGYAGISSFKGKINFSYYLNAGFTNRFGGGEQFKISANRINNLTQLAEATVIIPYIFNTKLSTTSNINMNKTDSAFTQININQYIKYNFNAQFQTGFALEYWQTGSFTSDNKTSINSKTKLYGIIYNQNVKRWMLEITSQISVTAGQRKTIDNEQLISKIRNNSRVKIYRSNPLYISVNWNSGLIITKHPLPTVEYFLTGGIDQLRGYTENSIPAIKFISLQSNLNYQFENKTGAFCFFDIQYYRNPEFDKTSQYLKSGGLGVQIKSTNNEFYLVYAVPFTTFSSINFKNAKIHFGVKTYF